MDRAASGSTRNPVSRSSFGCTSTIRTSLTIRPRPFARSTADRPYDGEIAYTDQQLGRLFDAVASKSPPENTLIAVFSDHGESFSEHGEYTHGVFLYDSTLRIPFLMAGGPSPGVSG